MDILRGKTPSMVRKELYVHFLAYNFAAKFNMGSWNNLLCRTVKIVNAVQLAII